MAATAGHRLGGSFHLMAGQEIFSLLSEYKSSSPEEQEMAQRSHLRASSGPSWRPGVSVPRPSRGSDIKMGTPDSQAGELCMCSCLTHIMLAQGMHCSCLSFTSWPLAGGSLS